METKSLFTNLSIKQKIIMLTVMVATIVVTTSLVITLKNLRSEMIDSSKLEITNIVELVYDVLGNYDAMVQKGELTLPEAQKAAIQRHEA